MTETNAAETAPKKRAGGLNAMLLADLKAMAGGMAIKGAGSMKKAQLVEAIKSAQAGAGSASVISKSEPKSEPKFEPKSEPALDIEQPTARKRAEREPKAEASAAQPSKADPTSGSAAEPAVESMPEPESQDERSGQVSGKAPQRGEKPERDSPSKPDHQDQGNQYKGSPDQDSDQGDPGDGEGRTGRNRRRRGRDRNKVGQSEVQQGGQQGNQSGGNQGNQGGGNQAAQQGVQGGQQAGQGGQQAGQGGQQGNQGNQGNQQSQRGNQGNRHEPDTTILEDDVVVPAAGILDVLDNYAFVRTSGYLPGPDDVYLSLSMVRKFGLRRGDAIAGQVRHPREGERREKFNPMVRIDSVNGHEPDTARTRAEFDKLTPLHPSERLRLETDAANLVGRTIDIAAPLGKGQRALIVSPAGAGKTMLLQSVAASVSANNPECHLMVVLVDERPEEVTDFERSVKGEVIASTFDRPASDHTTVAELAIERAKRLVELGHDVVVLLDGITRLGRAYGQSVPPTGRVLAGGIDSAALHPPKKFFGAARNIENGGSLTILATATVESGSTTDEVILEEFQGTSNCEIRLRSDLAASRLFPAIDVASSGTRREDLLLGEQELAIVGKLRQALATLDAHKAHELMADRLRRSHSNIEFLTQVQTTSHAALTAGQVT